MIVVTGATGQLGRAIVQQLLKRTQNIGISVRDAVKAAEFSAAGVRVRKADFEDAESLRHAFEGATQVLMVSSNARATGGDPLAQHRRATEVARAAGVKRIFYTSQISASPTSAFNPGLDHGATELMLRESGLPFTSLRNGFYATTAVAMTLGAIKSGELVAPADGKFSWVAHADLAEAAAVTLTGSETFEGPTPPLTGAEALDFTQLCALASELTGREIRRITVSDDEYCERMIAKGTPAGAAKFMLGMFIAARRTEFAAVDPTLERLIGRKPISVRELLIASGVR